MTKKSIIDTYYCSIYDVYLVVANQYVTLEELQKLYCFSDKVELDNDILNAESTTSTCIRKEDEAYCILVKYNHPTKCSSRDKTLNFINTISHEAAHAALDIYEAVHQKVCFCSPEPFCYLLGWATECIYKTLHARWKEKN